MAGSRAHDQKLQILRDKSLNRQKLCFNCGTTKTPLWRRVPDGAKKLRNSASGLKSRKYEAYLGPNKKSNKKKSGRGKKVSLKKKLSGLTNLFLSHKLSKERRWKNLSTYDQAALMLMSLGS